MFSRHYYTIQVLLLLKVLSDATSMASSSLTINNNNNNTTIQMRPIELDEFDQINQSSSSLIVANLTKLLLEHFNEQIKIDLIEFDSNKSNNQEEQDELNSYFYIIDTQLNSTTTSTFLLKLNRNKRIDRELICPFVTTTTTNSSTTLTQFEEECILNVDFYLNKMFHLILPIKINDINDMKPFFYQNEIQIDMLSDIILEQQKQNKMMPFSMMFVSMQQQRIPLKMAIDLDATRQNRILNYTLSSSSSSDNQTNEFITIKYVHEKSLDLYVNMTKLIWQQQRQRQEKDLIKIFYLRAYDSMYTSEQMIRIKFSKILFQKREREQTKKKLETFAIFEKNFFNFSLKSAQHEHSIQLSVNLKKNILLGDVDHYNKASHSISIKKSIEEEEESATDGNVVCQNGQIKFELFNLTPNGRRQVNMSKISTDNYNHYLNIEFNKNNESQLKLIATCLNTKQKDVALIMLNYLFKKTTTTKLLNVNMISALNQFDLTKEVINNNQTIFEIRFKNSSLVNINHINNTTLLTMAYLMIDNEESSRSIFNVHILKQHLISHKESKLSSSDMDIFQLNQMRNGLYAISLSNRDFIETFLSSSSENDDDEEKFDLKLEFSIRANKEEEEKLSFLLIKDLSLSKNFTLNVLRKMNDDTNDEFYSTKKLNTSYSLSDSKMISSNNNNSLNLFNSVIIITTASIILVIFGITCFIVSISLYITSKCRLLTHKLKTTTSKKKTTTTTTTTTNGTNTNNLSFYSQHLSSSSSSSSSSPRVTNTQTNVSPATSIMTSLEIIQKSSSTSLGSSSSSSSLRSHSKNNITNSNQQNDRQLIICSALSSSSSSTSSSSSNNSTRALSTKKKKSSLSSSSTSHAPINTIMVYDMMPPPTSSSSTSNTPPLQPPPLPPPSHLGKF
jgi:hypothetical protein